MFRLDTIDVYAELEAQEIQYNVNPEITKRGNVYKTQIEENNYDVFGANIDLSVAKEPDIDTMSDGHEQLQVKMRLECIQNNTNIMNYILINLYLYFYFVLEL